MLNQEALEKIRNIKCGVESFHSTVSATGIRLICDIVTADSLAIKSPQVVSNSARTYFYESLWGSLLGSSENFILGLRSDVNRALEIEDASLRNGLRTEILAHTFTFATRFWCHGSWLRLLVRRAIDEVCIAIGVDYKNLLKEIHLIRFREAVIICILK